MFPIDTHVVVLNDDMQRGVFGAFAGRVVGHGLMEAPAGGLHPVYLIAIDPGFWSENHSCYVQVITAHPDYVRKEN